MPRLVWEPLESRFHSSSKSNSSPWNFSRPLYLANEISERFLIFHGCIICCWCFTRARNFVCILITQISAERTKRRSKEVEEENEKKKISEKISFAYFEIEIGYKRTFNVSHSFYSPEWNPQLTKPPSNYAKSRNTVYLLELKWSCKAGSWKKIDTPVTLEIAIVSNPLYILYFKFKTTFVTQTFIL